ncbi:MAG: hypothetical protein ACF8OB_12405, partial [Phycisphaeraceae bacterium JB051]
YLSKGTDMLSPLWQRLGILLGIGLGSLCWLGILPSLQNPTGADGLVLMDMSSIISALVLLLIASIPSIFLGTILSTMGRFTAGVCIFSGSLLVLAYWAGPSVGWLNRAQIPGDYWKLIVETVIWQLFVLAGILVMNHFRPLVHKQLPQLLKEGPAWKTKLRFPATRELAAAMISTIIAGIMAYLLIRNASSKQVLASLFLSFALGAGIGQTMMPNTNPIAIFLSPGIVAILSYLMVVMRYDDSNQLYHAIYIGTEPGVSLFDLFPGSALALPIQYFSAGILGCSIGVGIVRAATDQQDETELA